MKFIEWLNETKHFNFISDNKVNYLNENSETLNKFGGIDKLDIGFMCNISLSDKYTNIIAPALIVNKYKIGEDEWPAYDVYFWTKTNTGEFSGAILLSQICLWRYLSDIEIDSNFIESAKSGALDNLIQLQKEVYSYSFMKNGVLTFISEFQYINK